MAIAFLLSGQVLAQPSVAPQVTRLETEKLLKIATNLTASRLKPTPNFEAEVVEPLRATQAEAAKQRAVKDAQVAQAAAEAARKAVVAPAVQTHVYTATSAPVGSIQDIIVKWATAYGVDPNWMLRVANCESGYSPGAVNYGYTAGGGHPSGIFQFLPQTFYGNAAGAGITSPDYSSPDDQAHVAAYMFSIGQSVQWQCK